VKKDDDIVAVYWTVPKGWEVDGKESDGAKSIKADDKVKIEPSKDFDDKSEITIKAVGVVEHGEKTLPRYYTIATGIPSFTKDAPIYDVGSVLHCFTPSQNATMQMLVNGAWKNEACKENLNPKGKSIQVTVRSTNTCGASASRTFDLVGVVDIDQKRTEVLKSSPVSSAFIYPNPATDLLFIQSKEGIAQLHCSNLMGQVFSVEINNQEVNISNLPKGVYILTITKEDGKVMHEKFIKE
jgi:hypothetical protein